MSVKGLKGGGVFFNYSYSIGLYDFINAKIPPASRLETIKKITELNNFKVIFKRFRGVKHKTLDRINVFRV
jgi:hypothetical protein